MKTSVKILTGVAAILAVFVICGLVIIRHDLKEMIVQSSNGVQYEEITLTEFNSIAIKSGWHVRITQSRDLSIEVQKGIPTDLIQIENNRIILGMREHQDPAFARIKLPMLMQLEASGSSQVRISDFVQDSLKISLTDQVVFTSKDNEITSIAIQTAENAQVIIEDDPMD